jgi:hypothetical protein
MSDCHEELTGNPLSNRVMQTYGAACIVKFCAARGVRSSCIDQLVKYLLELLTSKNLPEWEEAGSMLELSGRESMLPGALSDCLLARDRSPFQKLLESVVEIGIADMYGADTDSPVQALCEARRILRACEIEPPEISGLRSIAPNESGWGRPLLDNQARLLEAWCLNHWMGRAEESNLGET